MDSCVFGCCAGIKCCSQKCFSFLFSLMEELYAIDQSWFDTRVSPLAVSQLFFFLFIFEKWNKQVAFTGSISTLTRWTRAARGFSPPGVCRSKPEGLPPALPTRPLIGWLADAGPQGKGQPALQVFLSQCARSALGERLRLPSSSLES